MWDGPTTTTGASNGARERRARQICTRAEIADSRQADGHTADGQTGRRQACEVGGGWCVFCVWVGASGVLRGCGYGKGLGMNAVVRGASGEDGRGAGEGEGREREQEESREQKGKQKGKADEGRISH